jgi:homoserine dehydrogenase
MPNLNLALVGFGNVGRALARLLMNKCQVLYASYDIEFLVTGIATGRHGMAIDTQGIDLETALQLVEKGQSLQTISKRPPLASLEEFVKVVPADILFENTPVNHATGQPAIHTLRAALEHNMHAITANKGPVVHGYRMLYDLAVEKNRRFLFESAVMDGAPIFSLFRGSLPAADLRGFYGILNSCTNLLIGLMEEGRTFDEAVAYAKSIGITETDPSADIDGWDAAIKVAALITVLMDIPFTPQQVERQGIRSLTSADIDNALQNGERWKLVCEAHRQGNEIQARVAPQRVPSTSPLYSINGTSSYAQFEMDVLPGLGIVESNPGPETTAYGLLADMINAVRGI